MDNIFKRTSAHWVRYDKYEWKESTDGVLYLTPAKDAVMSLYNPIKEYEELVQKITLPTSCLLTRSLLKKKVWNLCGIQIAGKCLR